MVLPTFRHCLASLTIQPRCSLCFKNIFKQRPSPLARLSIDSSTLSSSPPKRHDVKHAPPVTFTFRPFSSTIFESNNNDTGENISRVHNNHDTSPEDTLSKVTLKTSTAHIEKKRKHRACSSTFLKHIAIDSHILTPKVSPQQQQQPAAASVPRNYWKNMQNQRQFFDSLAAELQIEKPEDWYNVTHSQVKSRGGAGLLVSYYGGSLMKALRAVYPEHNWDSIRTKKVPAGHWQDTTHHREFFDKVANDLGVTHWPDDWFNKVKPEDVRRLGGAGLLKTYYHDSLMKALRAVYPDHNWDQYLQHHQHRQKQRNPNNFWKDPNVRREFFKRLEQELGIRQLDDWYRVQIKDIIERGGARVLRGYYNNSLLEALRWLYPEHSWDESRLLKTKPKGHWKDPTTRREVFDRLGEHLGIKHLDDWYSVSFGDVIAANQRGEDGGGARTIIVKYYGSSLARALQAIYPEHNWQPWRFLSRSSSIDNDDGGDNQTQTNLQRYIHDLGAELEIKHLDDWYRVSHDQILRFGGQRHLARAGGLYLALTRVYPHHQWDEKRLASSHNSASSNKKATQRWLLLSVQRMFPSQEVIEEYHLQLQLGL